MDNFFNPAGIAIIGASGREGSVGWGLLEQLIQGGYSGRVVPVNPKYESLHGLPCLKSITETAADPVDMAVIATPIATVPGVIRECVQARTKGVVIISSGGRELGNWGSYVEEQIRIAAEGSDLRIIGPNCMGIIRPDKKLNASLATKIPARGNLAVISQSGAICAAILDRATHDQIGFSHFIGVGSMLDVNFGDLIDYLGSIGSVRAILLYMESLNDPRRFMSAARAVARIKPIIVLKTGKSEAGAKAASTHTGAMVGVDAVYDAAFKRAGIVRVPTLARLFDCAELLAKQPRPTGTRLAIITNGGGPGVMAADALAEYGLQPAPLPEEVLQELNAGLPEYWSHSNPIDIRGTATLEHFHRAVEICLAGNAFDSLLVIMVPQVITSPEEVARDLVSLTRRKRIPIFVSFMGGDEVEEGVNILNHANIPTYETPERAVRAFMYLVEYANNLEMLTQVPPKLATELEFNRDLAFRTIYECFDYEASMLSEYDSKRILASYGVPVNETHFAADLEEALDLARKLPSPWVLKLVSPDITHKSKAGGVALNLHGEEELTAAYTKIMEIVQRQSPEARILGVTVQSHITTDGLELLMGCKRDAAFGSVLLFGAGGVLTELLHDRAIGLPPLNRLLARRMMEETRIMSFLEEAEEPAARLDELEELLMRLSQLVIDFPEIVELDMNPIALQQGRPIVLDARIRLAPRDEDTSPHLVISPYPQHLERHDFTDMQLPLFIRPVKPEDAPLFTALFDTLTPTSIYYRFFSVVKSLTPEALARFTQIDYDREISFVGLEDREGDERMLGVAHIAGEPDGRRGEFSVLVGDPWQGKGVGAKLLLQCLEIAQERGMEVVWGTVLAENQHMLALGKKLGFTVSPGGDSSEFKLTIDLKKAKL
ncbi:MAG: GNAT family N-acetyltransferase [bacterium]|nr:GNAT family N-acetyltransferase [bacterium]